MTDVSLKVTTNPSDILKKIKEFEQLSDQRGEWPTAEGDLEAGIEIMMAAFNQAGMVLPATLKKGDEVFVAAWVRQIEAHFQKLYGPEKGAKISSLVLERLSAVAEKMAGSYLESLKGS